MMPKEVLTDRTIRAEVLPGLSLGRICSLLERFQPDDFAADPLPRGDNHPPPPPPPKHRNISFFVMRKGRDEGNPLLEVTTTFHKANVLSGNFSNT